MLDAIAAQYTTYCAVFRVLIAMRKTWRLTYVTKVRAQNVYKVFGRRESEAVKRLSAGASAQEVKNLGTAAVIDASFDVNEGEIFVVMGLSG